MFSGRVSPEENLQHSPAIRARERVKKGGDDKE